MSRPGGPLVRLGQWLMSRVPTGDRNRQGLLGDLDELYSGRRDAGRGFTADVWYLKEAVVAALRLGRVHSSAVVRVSRCSTSSSAPACCASSPC